nr:17.9 kDa class II heat shock protein-like [Ipomoea batatas]
MHASRVPVWNVVKKEVVHEMHGLMKWDYANCGNEMQCLIVAIVTIIRGLRRKIVQKEVVREMHGLMKWDYANCGNEMQCLIVAIVTIVRGLRRKMVKKEVVREMHDLMKWDYANCGNEMQCLIVAIVTILFHPLHHIMDYAGYNKSSSSSAPSRTLDAKAIAAIPADVKEYRDSYVFIIDMPGVKSGDIKVQMDEKNVLSISGERKREMKEREGTKYVRMERRMGKLMRKFVLPENSNKEKITAVCEDGVMTVTVEKLWKPRTNEVKIA